MQGITLAARHNQRPSSMTSTWLLDVEEEGNSEIEAYQPSLGGVTQLEFQ